ncbi:MAG: AI-2E family transporter [Candidatus Berkelbacteria bacterium]|nr:AI-2E family transporter [Candidatus Berkelbacteria bacterium]
MPEKVKFEISTWTVVKVLLIAVAFYLLFLVKDVVALFFIVLILSATFSPVVKSWQKYLGRVMSIIALFLILAAIIFAVVYIVIPPLVVQASQLAQSIPDYINNSNFANLRQHLPNIQNTLDNLVSNLGTLSSNLYSFTAGIVSAIFAVIMVLILTFYMLIGEQDIKKFVSFAFAENQRENAIIVINKIAAKVGSWFRGQMLLGLAVFLLDFIGLSILQVPYALILAVIAGLLELIPTIGPIVAAVISALIALTISPWTALFVIILYLVVALLENAFLVPKIMQKAVGISPVVILLALLVGAKLMGIVGAILSIPLAASLSVVILEWPTISKIFSKENA